MGMEEALTRQLVAFVELQAYRATPAVGDEHARLTRLHGERAERAFRRARSWVGMEEALTRQLVVFLEQEDWNNVEYALAKLEILNPSHTAWWRSFVDGHASWWTDPAQAAEALGRCLETVDVLGGSSEAWRKEIGWKLAFLRGSVEGVAKQEGVRDHLANLVLDAIHDVPPQHSDRRSRDAVRAAEALRPIVSEVKQRELSQTLDPLYTAVAVIADRRGDYADTLTTVELNTARSLLARMSMHQLRQQIPRVTFERATTSHRVLSECLFRYQQSGQAGDLKVLNLALKRRREVSNSVEEQIIGLAPVPRTICIPITVDHFRGFLGDTDAAVVYSPIGAIYGLERTAVRRLGQMDTAGVERACQRFASLAARADTTDTLECDEAAHTIASLCLDPVRGFLADKTRVLVDARDFVNAAGGQRLLLDECRLTIGADHKLMFNVRGDLCLSVLAQGRADLVVDLALDVADDARARFGARDVTTVEAEMVTLFILMCTRKFPEVSAFYRSKLQWLAATDPDALAPELRTLRLSLLNLTGRNTSPAE
jgi:hypothetical protein